MNATYAIAYPIPLASLTSFQVIRVGMMLDSFVVACRKSHMALTPPQSCLIQMSILGIVIVVDEHIWCLYGEVPNMGGGLRNVQQGEGRLSSPLVGEGFGGSLAEVCRPCPRTCRLAVEV